MAEWVCWNCEEAIDEDNLTESEEERVLCLDCDAGLQPEEIAAAEAAEIRPDDLSQPIVQGGRAYFEGGGMRLLVIEEDNIDQEFAESCEQYIDDCVLNDVADTIRLYFNYNQFTEDAKTDGYGPMFGYEYEHEVYVNGVMYHVFTD